MGGRDLTTSFLSLKGLPVSFPSTKLPSYTAECRLQACAKCQKFPQRQRKVFSFSFFPCMPGSTRSIKPVKCPAHHNSIRCSVTQSLGQRGNMGRGSTLFPPRHLAEGARDWDITCSFPLTPHQSPARLVPKGWRAWKKCLSFLQLGLWVLWKIRALWTRNVELCPLGRCRHNQPHKPGLVGKALWREGKPEGRLEVVGGGRPGCIRHVQWPRT